MENNVIELFTRDSSKEIEDLKMVRAKTLSQIFDNTTQSTFDGWVRNGLLTRHKIGGGVYYKVSEVRKLIENSAESKVQYGRN